MRIRKIDTNCSWSISFDELKEYYLDVDSIVFSEDYEQFCIVTLPKGEVTDVFDVFWESEVERVDFISFVQDLGF